jgi:DNA-binding IclR family transcriptional regulator
MGHEYRGVDLEGTEPVLVSNVAAPVFGSDSEVVMGLTAQGFAEPMTGPEIAAVGRRLVASTRHLTRASGGHAPDDPPG